MRLFAGLLHTYFTLYLYILLLSSYFSFCYGTMLLVKVFPTDFLFSLTFLSFCLFILEWKIEMNSELNWKFIAIMIYLALCCGCYVYLLCFLITIEYLFESFIFAMQMLIVVNIYLGLCKNELKIHSVLYPLFCISAN